MIAGEVIIVEGVRTGHPLSAEVTHAGTEVHLGAIVGKVETLLGEDHLHRCVVPGEQEVKLRVLEGEVTVNAETNMDFS
jgi:hypothetical protein